MTAHYSESFKIDIVVECMASGLSRHVFYQQNKDRIGVGITAFYSWCNKYKHHYSLRNGVIPEDHLIDKTSIYYGSDGKPRGGWIKTTKNKDTLDKDIKAIINGLRDDIPQPAIESSQHRNRGSKKDLLALYVITDLHVGMRSDDWNIDTAKKVVQKYIDEAANYACGAEKGVLVFQGDTAHFDSMSPVTPTSKNVLDADGNARDMTRAIIHIIRYAVDALLSVHNDVHIIFASGNHDEYTAVVFSEMLAMHYANMPNVTVDTDNTLYHCVEWGKTSLYFHHGHKRNLNDISMVFAGMFSETFGRTKYRYGHIGHFHSAAMKENQLMTVEIHRTLSGKDDYARHGGWLSNRSAKAMLYSQEYGLVSEVTFTSDYLESIL